MSNLVEQIPSNRYNNLNMVLQSKLYLIANICYANCYFYIEALIRVDLYTDIFLIDLLVIFLRMFFGIK